MERYEKRHPVSSYLAGDQVYVRPARKAGKLTRGGSHRSAVLMQAHRTKQKYLVRFDNKTEAFVSVADIAGSTRSRDLKRRHPSSKKLQINDYVRPTSTVQEFVNEINFLAETAPFMAMALNARQHNLFVRGHAPGDGHCMFHAIANGLNKIDGL